MDFKGMTRIGDKGPWASLGVWGLVALALCGLGLAVWASFTGSQEFYIPPR